MRESAATGLERLDDRERYLLELVYFRVLTHSEMAVMSRQPLGAVKSRVRHALRNLREHLEDTSLNDNQ